MRPPLLFHWNLDRPSQQQRIILSNLYTTNSTGPLNLIATVSPPTCNRQTTLISFVQNAVFAPPYYLGAQSSSYYPNLAPGTDVQMLFSLPVENFTVLQPSSIVALTNVKPSERLDVFMCRSSRTSPSGRSKCTTRRFLLGILDLVLLRGYYQAAQSFVTSSLYGQYPC